MKYFQVWLRIEELTGDSSEALILALYNYIGVLAVSQRDTYTNPFEIVGLNLGKFYLFIFRERMIVS